MYFLNKKTKQKTNLDFFIIFYQNFFLTVFTLHFCKKITFEIFKPNLQVLKTADSHIIKTTKKD